MARIAILRFENLSGDGSADWMGRAFSEIIAAELASAPGIYTIAPTRLHGFEQQAGVRPIAAPGISAERALAFFSGATRLGYGDYSIRGGRLRARLTLEDATTGRMVRVITAEAAAGDVGAAASSLAHQIAPRAGKYGTANRAAVEAYMTAMESGSPARMSEGAWRAIAADPDFGPAYRMLAGAKARQQDSEGALAVLGEAMKRGDAIPAAERARIALEAATLRNDLPARRQALAELVRVEPGDTDACRSLADLSYAAHDYGQAAAAYRQILAMEPDNPAALNSLGYAYAYSGNLDVALASLRRYQTLRPNDANALDSTGDVYLISGNLSAAEKFYQQAFRKDPNFQGAGSEAGDLFKAAMARLMTGDIPGADALARQYDDARTAAHDPAVPYRQAEWSWITGRRKQACQQLAAFAQRCGNGPLKELASRAYSELALWSLMLDDRDGAGEMLRKSMQFAGPNSAATAVLVRFLAQSPAPAAEWTNRAGLLFRSPAQSPVKDLWLAYAFLLNQQFDAASGAVQRLYDGGANGADEALPVLLAWTRVETGRVSDAAGLLRFNPVPPLSGTSLFTSLYFPRLYYLRGVVAEKQGRHEEARAAFQLFLKLSGPTPLHWGEEQKAKQAAR
jgi:tetratricopeptide (TPR) repeat protein